MYRQYYNRVMKIRCAGCGQVVKVSGQVWRYRLRHSKKDASGCYLGWNCDPCADRIEGLSAY